MCSGLETHFAQVQVPGCHKAAHCGGSNGQWQGPPRHIVHNRIGPPLLGDELRKLLIRRIEPYENDRSLVGIETDLRSGSQFTSVPKKRVKQVTPTCIQFVGGEALIREDNLAEA